MIRNSSRNLDNLQNEMRNGDQEVEKACSSSLILPWMFQLSRVALLFAGIQLASDPFNLAVPQTALGLTTGFCHVSTTYRHIF